MRQKEETVKVADLATGYQTKKENIVVTRDINASLYSRELTCLLGPNGAGKSTLLRTLTAFQPPLAGRVMIEGKPLEDYAAGELSKVIGVVLTEKPSLDNMSVEELVGLGRSPYTGFWGSLGEDDRNIVDESIRLVGIDGLRERMVHTLSDGERQKVMIAKALAQETPVIFLDEPTAFLDYPSKVEIMQLLQRLARERNKTVFLSTHDLELALQIVDKVWLLDKPHGVTIGTPEDLALSGALNVYFQREGMTFDRESGLFRIDHRVSRSARLTGDGAGCRMAKKALAREGIEGDPEGDESITVVATDGRYVVNGTVVDSIESLLDEIRRL